MISAIPNQPIAFDSSRLRGCCTLDPEECLLVDTSDTIIFQVQASRCATDTQHVTDPGFDTGEGWKADGWIIDTGLACYSRLLIDTIPTDGGTLSCNDFSPVPGQFYEVHAFVDSSTARSGVRVSFGGVVLGDVNDPGEYVFFVTAISGGFLTFTSLLNPGESLCLEAAEVFSRSTDYTLQFVQNETVIYSTTYDDGVATFLFSHDRLTVSLDLNDVDEEDLPVGCYSIQFSDDCDADTLTSQCVFIGDHACTVVLTACSGADMLGFKDGFRPQMRVVADLKRPTFDYEVGEEKSSDGTLNRYYAERTRSMELRIGKLGEFGHNFVSSLALWDHVYIGQDPWVVKPDSYEPSYDDVYSAHGGVLMSVTPYQEDARKVRCVEDEGGCAPPPNYWVQDTGPNEDYILQEGNNARILLN